MVDPSTILATKAAANPGHSPIVDLANPHRTTAGKQAFIEPPRFGMDVVTEPILRRHLDEADAVADLQAAK
jgi:hypothetical protein